MVGALLMLGTPDLVGSLVSARKVQPVQVVINAAGMQVAVAVVVVRALLY